MYSLIILKGIFIGVLIALPTGPVGILIMRRMYLFGLRSGMYSACGTIFSDAFYGVVVGFGLKHISSFLISISKYTELVAGIALIYLGYRLYTQVFELDSREQKHTPIQDITSTALLNLLNPTLVFSFTTLFLVMHMNRFVGNHFAILLFLFGIALGTLMFWYWVGKGIENLHRRNRGDVIQEINRVTGIILSFFGSVLALLAVIHIVRELI